MATPPICLQHIACGHQGMISGLAFSSTGIGLASSSLDSNVCIWQPNNPIDPKRIEKHSFNVTAVVWAPHGQALATASDDRKVILWAYPSLQEAGELLGHSKGITRLAWSPNGADLVTCSNDRRIRIFEVVSRKLKTHLEGHVSLPRCIAHSPDSKFLASGSEDGTVRLWKGDTYVPDRVLYGHRGAINQLSWLPDGRLITASDDGNLRIWNSYTGDCLHVINGHDGPVKAAVMSSCGRLLATKSWDQTLRLWRTDNWSAIALIEEETAAPFPNLAFHPKQGILASVGSLDRVVRLWKLNIDALANAAPAGELLSFYEVEAHLLKASGQDELASAEPRRKKPTLKNTSDRQQKSTTASPVTKTATAIQPPPTQPKSAALPTGPPPAEISCLECGEIITGAQLQRRRAMGFHAINCPVCETKIELSNTSSLSLHDWAGTRKLILAVMFTDIVDSTALASHLGNQAMKAVRHQHFTRVRDAIKAHHGFEIKTIGDSFMATYKTVGDGLDCALDVLRNTGHQEIKIRASLHVGPVEVEENDLFGSMVNFCSRLMGKAEGPELVVSEEARSHVMQEGEERHVSLPWDPYDNLSMKGFPGSWRVWALQ